MSPEQMEAPVFEELLQEYIGTWNLLVSQTNWEKGRVIFEWRSKMIAAEAPHNFYTDESWAKRVGGVSSQHVGRLRRVFERFDNTRLQYKSLYWSHFFAAIEWDDSETWLEEAAKNRWSVAEMRINRCNTLGIPFDKKTADFVDEDEDLIPRDGTINSVEKNKNDDDEEQTEKKKYRERMDYVTDPSVGSTGELLGELSKAQELPDDLKDAFEQMKIAILNHRAAEWKTADQKQVLCLIESLKGLIVSV